MTIEERRYLKFVNSDKGQGLDFDWIFIENRPCLLIITNKINGLTLSTFEGTVTGIHDMVAIWALRMIEDDLL